MRTLPPRLRLDLEKLDIAVAIVLTLGLELETWLGGNAQGHRVALTIGGPLVTAAVAFRRRYPTAVGVWAGVWGSVMQSWWPSAELTVGIAWICDVYGLAVWSPSSRLRVALPAVVAFEVGVSAATGSRPKDFAPFVIISTAAILFVRLVVGERDRRAQMAERERDLVAREAVVEERARIARELHDAIAHNVSMMVGQAGAERRVLGDRERRAQLAERERDVAAREAVVGERARIARELHDAIAHNV